MIQRTIIGSAAIADKEGTEDHVQHLSLGTFHIAPLDLPAPFAALFASHITFQSNHRIRTVQGTCIDRVAAHIRLKCLVVAAYRIGSSFKRIWFVKAVLRKDDIAHEMSAAAAFSFPELANHLAIGHVDILWLGVNSSVRPHAIKLALLIADDCHSLLKGTKLFNVTLNRLLKLCKGIPDLCNPRNLTGFAKNHLDLVLLILFSEIRIELDLLEADVVAKMERRIAVIVDDFYNIRNRKRSALVSRRMFDVEFSVYILQIVTIDFSLKYSVIDSTVDFGRSLELLEVVHS